MKENILEIKSMNFAVRILKLSDFLFDKKQSVIAYQIMKSGTSIGANIAESKYGASKLDFANKLQISQKEAGETKYWLELIYKAEIIEENLYKSLLLDVEELLK